MDLESKKRLLEKRRLLEEKRSSSQEEVPNETQDVPKEDSYLERAGKGVLGFLSPSMGPGIGLLKDAAKTGMGGLEYVGDKLNEYSSAPSRSAISAGIKGENPVSAFKSQFGEDPSKAPSGGDIASQIGVPDLPDSTVNPKDVAGMLIELFGDASNVAIPLLGKSAGIVGKTIKMAPNKNEAGLITKAAESLGFKPTKGMLSSSPYVQNVESSLEQSPSIAGSLVRQDTNKVRQGIEKGSEKVFGETPRVQPSDVGSKVKEGITKNIQEQKDTIGSYYDDLRNSTQSIDVNPGSLTKVAKNIKEIEKFKSSPGFSIVNQIADDLQNIKSVDDIKSLRSNVGKRMSTPNIGGAEYNALSQVYGKLSKLEQNTMMRAAIKQARTNPEGLEIGKEMVSDLKSANKQYKGLIEDVREIGQGSKISKNIKHVDEFIDKLDQIPDEKIVDTMFKVENRAHLNNLKDKFPDQYESMRQAKIDSIRKSVELHNGKVDVKRLLSTVKGMEPDTIKMVFGDDAKVLIDNLKTVVGSLPEKIGPSGTPKGLEWGDLFSPAFWLREPSKLAQYGVYKGSGAINKAGGMLRSAEKPKNQLNTLLGAGLLKQLNQQQE